MTLKSFAILLTVLLCSVMLATAAVDAPANNLVALTVQVQGTTATVEAFGLVPCASKVEGILSLETRVGADWVLVAPQSTVSLDVIRGQRKVLGKFDNLPMNAEYRASVGDIRVASTANCVVGTTVWPTSQTEYAHFVVGEVSGWNSPLVLSLMRDTKGRRLVEVAPYATSRRVIAWRTCSGSGLNALTGCANRAEMFFGGGGVFFTITDQLIIVPTPVGTDSLDVFYVLGNDGNSFSLYIREEKQ